MYNVLTEPQIRMIRSNGIASLAALPEVIAALMADDVESFPALQSHQRHAFHAFIVQLAAIAMHRLDLREPPTSSDIWLDAIRGITETACGDAPAFHEDEPWHLVADDITLPAFLQPPASDESKWREFSRNRNNTPDGLDVVLSGQNHKMKSDYAVHSNVDDWIFALITLQTMEGYSGPGKYGISRMNGGLGNRPAFSLTPSDRHGAHVRRDVMALLEHFHDLEGNYPMTRSGLPLLWLLPWDGGKNEILEMSKLHPIFIEVCRRVRMGMGDDGKLHANYAISKSERVNAKPYKGVVGDPWTPVDKKRNVALTMAQGGFTYKRITDYLTSANWERPALLYPTESEAESGETMFLMARTMVRGMGKSAGYYERVIPIRHKVQMQMRRQDGMEELGKLSERRIEEIGKVQRILSHAIQIYAGDGDSSNSGSDFRPLARPWLNRLDAAIDATFFHDLQVEFEADESIADEVHNKWLMNGKTGVVDQARNVLKMAQDSTPCKSISKYKAVANSNSMFEGRIRGDAGLPFLFNRN